MTKNFSFFFFLSKLLHFPQSVRITRDKDFIPFFPVIVNLHRRRKQKGKKYTTFRRIKNLYILFVLFIKRNKCVSLSNMTKHFVPTRGAEKYDIFLINFSPAPATKIIVKFHHNEKLSLRCRFIIYTIFFLSRT